MKRGGPYASRYEAFRQNHTNTVVYWDDSLSFTSLWTNKLVPSHFKGKRAVTNWSYLQAVNELDPTVLTTYINGFLGGRSQNCERLRHVRPSLCLFVRPSAWTTYLPPEGFLRNLNIWLFFENLSTKFKVRYILTRIPGTLHKTLRTFFIPSHRSIHSMINISDKSCREHLNTYFMSRKSRLLWDNVKKDGTVRQATHDDVRPWINLHARWRRQEYIQALI